MKRKTLLKLTACGLVGALTIGNFTVAAYAAPTAGVASLASDIATTSSAPTAGFSLALSEVAEKVEDEATVASAQPEVKEVEAPPCRDILCRQSLMHVRIHPQKGWHPP